MEILLNQEPLLIFLFKTLQMNEINCLMRTCKNLHKHSKLNFYKDLRIAEIQKVVLDKYHNYQPKSYRYYKLTRNHGMADTKSIQLIKSLAKGFKSDEIIIHPQEYQEFSKMLLGCGVCYGDILDFDQENDFFFLKEKLAIIYFQYFNTPKPCYILS